MQSHQVIDRSDAGHDGGPQDELGVFPVRLARPYEALSMAPIDSLYATLRVKEACGTKPFKPGPHFQRLHKVKLHHKVTFQCGGHGGGVVGRLVQRAAAGEPTLTR